MSPASPLPLDAALLVAHRPPMLLVNQLIACDGDTSEAVARFPADSPLATESGEIEPVFLIELMAQTCAVAEGYRGLQQDRPPHVGYLVGVTKTELTGSLRVGETCHIRATVIGVLGAFAVTEATVVRDGQVIAKGTIKTWERNSDTP